MLKTPGADRVRPENPGWMVPPSGDPAERDKGFRKGVIYPRDFGIIEVEARKSLEESR